LDPPATPPFTKDLVLHLDASDVSTITGDTNLSNWGDNAGDDNDATAFNGPQWGVKTQNGLNVVTFDGVDDYFTIAASTGNNTLAEWDGGVDGDYSIWIVASTDTGTGSGVPPCLLSSWGDAGHPSAVGFEFCWDNSELFFDTLKENPLSYNTFSAATAGNLGQFYILNVNNYGTTIHASIDGRIVAEDDSGSGSGAWGFGPLSVPIHIGTDSWLNSNFDGDIAEILIYKGDPPGLRPITEMAPGVTTVNVIGHYLAKKWGIANTAYVSETPESELQDQIASLQVQMAGLQTLLDSSYVIHLEAGWNLVSLGKEAQEHDVTDILGNAHSGAVWTWQDGRFQTTTTMQSQKGYWIYAVEQAEIEVQLP
jgi:hypothetical protein